MASVYRHKRGDTFTSRIALRNKETGGYVDLSEFAVRQHIRHARSHELLVRLEEFPDPLYDGSKEVVVFAVPADITAGWEPATYESDIEIADPQGTVVSTSTIKIVIEEDITHD